MKSNCNGLIAEIWSSALRMTIVLCVAVASAAAYRDGISGYTQVGCGGRGCHGTQPSTLTTVSLTGNLTVDPNTANSFTLTVQHSSQAYAGFDLAVFDQNGQPAGNLLIPPGQNTYIKLLSGELTHTNRRTMSGTPRTAQWQFQWRSPARPGKYVIRAAGNAVNGDNAASPVDEWNFLTPVTVTVRGIVIVSPTQSQTFCAGDTVMLQWIAYGITTTGIAFSTDGGQNWTQVTTVETREGTNTFRYTIPTNLMTTRQYRFRLINGDNDLVYSDTPDMTVNPKTAIRNQPTQPSPQCEGGTATLSVTAVGTNLTFQWQHDGTPVPGATSSQLVLSNLTVQHAGRYACLVGGACGTVTSNAVTVVVNPKPKLLAQSTDTTVTENSPAELYVAIAGDSTATYQWLKDGSPIAGATSNRLVISRAALRDSGIYTARITNPCGSIESEPIRLRVQSESSVEIEQQSLASLYPQPADEYIVVESMHAVDRVTVYDMRGEQVIALDIQPAQQRIRLDLRSGDGCTLAAGFYVVVVGSNQNTARVPLLVAPR